jgi:UDP-glucose-4-epimerase GalE
MRVLVTGGAGYVGSHATKALAQAGHEPVVLDNLSFGHPWAVQWGSFIEGDLEDTGLLNRILREHRIEAVMHFAASCLVGESVGDPQKYFWNNVVNTLRLLDAMKANGVRPIVVSSSAATYGNPEKIPMPEDHSQRPVNPYGETKLSIERMLHWYGLAFGLRWIALRYFNAAGADLGGQLGEEHNPETHLIPLVIQTALGLQPVAEIYGADYPTQDGSAVRDYVHVTDLADAHLRAMTHLEAEGESTALNLGTGKGHSVREVISMVEQVSGKRIPVREAPRRAGDPAVLVADPRKAEQVLDWRPAHSDLRTIIDSAWRWHSSRAKKK